MSITYKAYSGFGLLLTECNVKLNDFVYDILEDKFKINGVKFAFHKWQVNNTESIAVFIDKNLKQNEIEYHFTVVHQELSIEEINEMVVDFENVKDKLSNYGVKNLSDVKPKLISVVEYW
jgi:uncharacterized coiled-coil protein SlyX